MIRLDDALPTAILLCGTAGILVRLFLPLGSNPKGLEWFN